MSIIVILFLAMGISVNGDAPNTFVRKGFYSDSSCKNVAWIEFEKTKEIESQRYKSVTQCREMKDGIFYQIEELGIQHENIGDTDAQLLMHSFTYSAECEPNYVSKVRAFPPAFSSSTDWKSWKETCVKHIPGSLKIVHDGEVTGVHTDESGYYRPKFKVYLYPESTSCTGKEELLYIGDETCKTFTAGNSHYGHRLDKAILDMLSAGSRSGIATVALVWASVLLLVLR